MTISFSQQQVNQFVANINSSAGSLKAVQQNLNDFKDQFNKVDVTLVGGQWDNEVDGNNLSGMNNTVIELIGKIDADFQELAHRQEELSEELSLFMQANIEVEQEAENAVESADGEG